MRRNGALCLLALGLGCAAVNDQPGVGVLSDDDEGGPDDDDGADDDGAGDDDTGPGDDDSLPAECGGGPVWDLQGVAAGLPDPYVAMEEAAAAPNDPGGFGGSLADLDGDGVLDMFLTNPQPVQPELWWGNGDGTYTEGFVQTGVVTLPDTWTRTVSPADYDGDGDLDVLILEHGDPRFPDSTAPLHLLRNDGGRQFTDVTATSGLDDGVDRLGFGASWGDYDQDGDLDVFLSNHFYDEDWVGLSQGTRVGDGCRLMRNEGDGTFVEVSSDFPEGSLTGLAYQAYWIDLDEDGDLDLHVGNDYGQLTVPDKLFRNDGPGAGGRWTWTDMGPATGMEIAGNVMGLAFGDPDHDSDLDLVVAWIGGILYLEQVAPLSFFDLTSSSFAGEHTGEGAYNIAWGLMFEDMDNDTWEDLLVTFADLPGSETGHTGEEQVPQLNAFFWGAEGGELEFAGEDHEMSDFGKARSLSIADLNGDGTLDVLMGGSVSGAPHLYVSRPECSSGHWLEVEVRLPGTKNLFGIGSSIRVTTDDGLTQFRQIDGGFRTTMSSSPPWAHFGLGGKDRVESVEVISPQGEARLVEDVAADQKITVTF